MSVRPCRFTPLAIVLLLLTACAHAVEAPTPASPTGTSGPTSTATRVPTRTPGPTWTPRPSSTPDPCTPSQVVRTLRTFIPYAEATMYYNVIDQVRELIVWFVDPDVNARASQAEVDEQRAIAAADAVLLAFRLNDHVNPCLTESFEAVFVVVVDQDYHAWFGAHIATRSLAPVSEPTLSQFDQVEIEPVYLRQEAPEAGAESEPVAGACSWPQIRRSLTALEEAQPGLEGSYLFSDESGIHVWTQRQLGDPTTVFFELWDLAPELACLIPQPDWVWVTVVDYRGQMTLFGRVPGEAMRSEAYPGEIMERFEARGP
jgi:hypothetical protein